jgi:hypothetical protein
MISMGFESSDVDDALHNECNDVDSCLDYIQKLQVQKLEALQQQQKDLIILQQQQQQQQPALQLQQLQQRPLHMLTLLAQA